MTLAQYLAPPTVHWLTQPALEDQAASLSEWIAEREAEAQRIEETA